MGQDGAGRLSGRRTCCLLVPLSPGDPVPEHRQVPPRWSLCPTWGNWVLSTHTSASITQSQDSRGGAGAEWGSGSRPGGDGVPGRGVCAGAAPPQDGISGVILDLWSGEPCPRRDESGPRKPPAVSKSGRTVVLEAGTCSVCSRGLK